MPAPKTGSTKKPAKLILPAPPKKVRKAVSVTHTVDLEPDSPKIRAMEREKAKRRGFKWAAAIIILTCLGALLRITIREAFVQNPQFALRQIAVQTEGPLTVQKIVRETGLTEGTNLLTINMRELRTRLERLPQVKKVHLERDYAGKLSIAVEQRRPVAWLECSKLGYTPGKTGSGHLLDAEGAVVPCETSADTFAALPVIRFESLTQATPGAVLPDLQIRSALRLVAQLQDRFEEGAPEVRLLDIVNPYSIVTTFADRTEVTFGVDDLELQLVRLDRVRQEIQKRQWQVATLNLLARENVPVTFRAAPDLTGLQAPAPRESAPPKKTQSLR